MSEVEDGSRTGGMEEAGREDVPGETNPDFHGDPDQAEDGLEGLGGDETLEAIPPRVAETLLAQRRPINIAAPDRNKDRDGPTGDGNHFRGGSANSDPNPHVRAGATGIVRGMDIAPDAGGGCDGSSLA